MTGPQTTATASGGQAAPARRRGRTWSRVALVLLLCSVVAWSARRTILVAAGQALVAEDSLAPVDIIAISSANSAGGALEAVQLYRNGMTGEILLMPEPNDPVDAAIEQLGIPRLHGGDMAKTILERSGVPDRAIRTASDFVDGTDTEVAVIAGIARERHPIRVLFITARSHTRRARWLLQRKLPPDAGFLVRSARTDTFAADSWWHSRNASREVAMEYLRWVNTLVLGDLWSRTSPRDRGVFSHAPGCR